MRVKNALLPYKEAIGKELYDAVQALLDEERPEARTLILFAVKGPAGKVHLERLDLQVELPIADIAHGRVEIHFGCPYLVPFLFAADEYERSGILVIEPSRWRFIEVFLGEAEEITEPFGEITPEEWLYLRETSEALVNELRRRFAEPPSRVSRYSQGDRMAFRLQERQNILYRRLGRLLQKLIQQLGISRFVIIAEKVNGSLLEKYLPASVQRLFVGHFPIWRGIETASPAHIFRQVEPLFIEAERRSEWQLLQEVKDKGGLWGIDPVLDALQQGRVQRWILPWSLELKLWYCPEADFYSALPEAARLVCDNPQEVALRTQVVDMAERFGAQVEFVREAAEAYLLREMNGMAATLRW